MRNRKPRRPATTSVHSIRTSEALWAKAKKRADGEGVPMNQIVVQILEGYAAGELHLPRIVKDYSQSVSPKKSA